MLSDMCAAVVMLVVLTGNTMRGTALGTHLHEGVEGCHQQNSSSLYQTPLAWPDHWADSLATADHSTLFSCCKHPCMLDSCMSAAQSHINVAGEHNVHELVTCIDAGCGKHSIMVLQSVKYPAQAHLPVSAKSLEFGSA